MAGRRLPALTRVGPWLRAVWHRAPSPSFSPWPTSRAHWALARDCNDLHGVRVIRKRTFARYLDAVTFPGGAKPAASPSEGIPGRRVRCGCEDDGEQAPHRVHPRGAVRP
ncbi:hypothetical protein [Myxococcus sp. CA039A]|uniref:hypothetical protein n=1 Tax=Myxococcus sp. CA039A TaxID=2741737 RepID=UPI00157BA9FF|nr:hypothetical protein [Myxococcus sp. CA039A]